MLWRQHQHPNVLVVVLAVYLGDLDGKHVCLHVLHAVRLDQDIPTAFDACDAERQQTRPSNKEGRPASARRWSDGKVRHSLGGETVTSSLFTKRNSE